MRFAMTLATGVAAAVLAAPASAEPVQQISFSPAMETAIQEQLGESEGAYLRDLVSRSVSAELAQRGAGEASGQIDISIVDAQPNLPTLRQGRRAPHLDIANSLSRGGAELHAVIRDADGAVVSEVDHTYYTPRIDEIHPVEMWSDARRAIRDFAEQVAEAYASAL